MTSVEMKGPIQPAWIFADPWSWGLLAFAAGALGLLWSRLFGDGVSAVRFLFIAIALLAAAVAVWLRLRSQAAILDAHAKSMRAGWLLGLASFDILLAITVTVLWIGRLAAIEALSWSSGSVLWMWLAVVPWCVIRAWLLLKRRAAGLALGVGLEKSCLLTVAAVATFLACWAFYLGPDRVEECDSLRLLLAVAALLLFAAAPLMAAPVGLRRAIVSLLVVLHLGGIVTAAVAAPPGPWIVVQAWVYFYRPYLEFMYLNNAYRFYSPEPAPATQLWFRIEYKDAQDLLHSRWTKLPDMNDAGQPRYAIGLQYQRRLALTEYAARTSPAPSFASRDATGKLQPSPFYKRRDLHSPSPELVGDERPVNAKKIPFHPDPTVPQYSPADASAKLLIESYARHLLGQPHPSNPALKPYRVKIYRVLHRIVEPNLLAMGNDPQDLTFFLPYYQGMYDAEGALLDPLDPFLYWILPILRDNPQDFDSPIRAWVFFHAGDEDWIKRPGLRRGPPGIP